MLNEYVTIRAYKDFISKGGGTKVDHLQSHPSLGYANGNSNQQRTG